MSTSLETAQANLAELAENPYPGRGIVIGLNTLGDTAIQAYWVMGRSENSRNRILVEEDNVVRTEAHDPAKVEDPSLIIYNAMRIAKKFGGDFHVVSNGDQTDTVTDGWDQGHMFKDSVRSRSYEPDAPNYTPRIAGLIMVSNITPEPGAESFEYKLSVTSKQEDTDEPAHSFYEGSISTPIGTGTGLCVHTYLGDGSPLPSFNQEPYPVPVGEGADDTAELYWERLNEDNRVAIAVKGINLATGKADYRIINAHQEAA